MSENCPIIAIDPGNTQSGYCVIDQRTLRPLEFGKIDNAELMQKLASATEQGWRWAVIEMVASYGMPVGREVFDTVLWIGRFYQTLNACCSVRLLSRKSGISATTHAPMMPPSGGHSLTALQTTTSKTAVAQRRPRISFTALRQTSGRHTPSA